MTVVQVRNVGMRMDDRGVAMQMGVRPRDRDPGLVIVLVVRIVRVGVIVLHLFVDVLVVVCFTQQES